MHRIWNGHGTFRVTKGNGYFHEGLDLIADSGTVVVASELGKVVEVRRTGAGDHYLNKVLVNRGSLAAADRNKFALKYLHINVGKKPGGGFWAVGDSVKPGDTIGYIAKNVHLAAHTHFEWENDQNGGWSPGGDRISDIEGNPIEILTPVTDNVKPVIQTPVRYRNGDEEGSHGAKYYKDSTASGDTIISGNVDIICRTYDRFNNFAGVTNFNINPNKVEFSVTSFKPFPQALTIPAKRPAYFLGRFLNAAQPDSLRNTWDKYRDTPALNQVNYENDATCNSTETPITASSGNADFWYILTNVNDNDVLESNDKSYYWDTNGKSGDAWNDRQETPAHEADSNKNALFPDGRYIVNVKSTGYGGAADTASLNDTVFINNFNEFIFSCDSLGNNQDTFCIGKPVWLRGLGFPVTTSFRVFVIKDTTWVFKQPMLGGAFRKAAATVTTDNQGRFGPVKIWNAYEPNGKKDKGYDIILDYDWDSLYTPKRKGLTVDVLDTTINNQKSIISADTMKVTTTKKDLKCNGDSVGCIKVVIKGGLKPYKVRIKALASALDTTIVTSDSTEYCKLKAGKYRLSVVGKDSCDVKIDTLQIRQPSKFSVQKTVINTTGCGNCNGSVNGIISGGTRPYQYAWSDQLVWTQDSVFSRSNLCAGWYYLFVLDSNGCTYIDSVNITGSPGLSVSGVVTKNSKCSSPCNGAVKLTVTGGTSPFKYSWTGTGGYTSTLKHATDICEGTYTVTVTDKSGCTVSQTYSVARDSLLLYATTTDNKRCTAPCDGSVTLTVSGGTTPYSYSWYGPSGYLTNTKNLSGLCAGTYTVYVNDQGGCNKSGYITIANNINPVTLAATVTKNTSCVLPCNGKIVVTVNGGTSPFSYSWSNGNTTKNNTQICGGTYILTVTDTKGCTAAGYSVVDDSLANITLTAAVTNNTSCSGSCNGSITVNPSGGSTPYSFAWSNGGTAQTISGLCTGIYTVTVTDSKGCTKSGFTTVAFQPSNISLTASVTNNTGCTLCNGSITVNPSGGSTPYSFAWSNGGTAQTISGLCTGIYTVTVTDSKGCTKSGFTTISFQPSNISLTASVTNNTGCGMCNGSITVNPSGGITPYSYSWSNGGTSQTIGSLCGGTYTVTVTDANGCTASGFTTVANSGGTLSGTTSSTPKTSCTNCNGSASAYPAGGTPPYSYNWSNGTTSQTATGLCSGQYTVSVSDMNGCSVILSAAVTDSISSFFLITSSADNTSCSGFCNGTATTNPSGNGPYTYLWSNGATSQTATGLCAGSYTVTVTNGVGCTTTGFTIVNNSFSTITGSTVAAANTSCNFCNGSAAISLSGGQPPYNYFWSNGASTQTATGLCSGNYSVYVSDMTGCSNAFYAFVPDSTTVFYLTMASTDNNTCSGQCNGTASATPSVPGPYTYSWSSGSSSQTATGLCAGFYYVTVLNTNGCSTSNSVYVNSNTSSLSLSSTVTNNSSCNGPCNGGASANVTGGFPPYYYSWSNGSTTQTVSGLCGGYYSVYITDNSGCSGFTMLYINNDTSGCCSVAITPSGPTNFCPGGSVTLNASGIGNFLWSTGASASSITVISAGTYTVTVTNSGCTSSASIIITTDCSMPNGLFTSNIFPGSATGNWSIQPCAIGYSFQYRPVGAGGYLTATITGNSGFYQMTGLFPNTQYEWKVSSICQDTPLISSPYTTTVTFTSASTGTGIGRISETNSSGVEIFPNPAKDEVTIVANVGAGTYTVTVTDMIGEELIHYIWNVKKKYDQAVLDLSNLNPGIYSVAIKNKEINIVKKVIRQ